MKYKKNSVTGGAQHVATSTSPGTSTGFFLVTQNIADPSDAKVFGIHAPPHNACENLVCARKLSAHQQTGGESVVDTLFEGL